MSPSTALWVSVLVLYSLIFVGSLVGNSLVLFIITKKRNTKTAMSFLFVNLAIADLIITVFAMPSGVAYYFRNRKWVEGVGGDILCRVLWFSYPMAIAASIFTLSVMSFDRFVAVMYPLKASRRRGYKVYTFVIWLSSALLMVPMLLTYSSKSGNCIADWSLLPIEEESGAKVLWVIYLVLLYFLPLSLMAILYSRMSCMLYRHKIPGEAPKETVRRKRDQNRRVVKLLVAVVLVFALCWFPVHAYHIYRAFPQLGKSPLYVMFLCFWCGHAHSAINPWMYIYLNSKFRSAFLEIIRQSIREIPVSRGSSGRRSTMRSTRRRSTVVIYRETAL